MAEVENEAMHPLLPAARASTSRPETARQSPRSAVVVEVDEDDPDMEEANDDDKELFADHKRRGTSLIWNDAILLLLHLVQIFAVLQGLALRWPFPVEWLSATSFVFLFNLDPWDFSKMVQNGTYKEVQAYYTPSTTMPFHYWHLMLAWGIFVFLALFGFAVAFLVITHKKHPFMMIQIARLQRVYIVLTQVVCVPLGTAIARLFHCTDAGVMEVDNSVPCYADGLHWAYVCPALALVVALYGLLPAWMVVRTRAELLNLNSDRHEGYLQLKEVEYVQGLDVLYLVGRFHMFSSFTKFGAHLRALLFIVSFCILLVVALTFNHIFVGAVVISCVMLLLLLVSAVVRPYRVTCFNLQLSFSYLCLVVFCLLGSLRASFNSFSLASAWLTPTYLNILLALIAGVWLSLTVVFVAYLVLRQVGLCSRFCPHPLWPSMTSDGLNKLSPETRKYVRAIVRCRTLVERSLAMPPMFAPAHEVARQIHVINAYCREAEHLRDPIHDTLWDVLDELLEAHSQIAPRSLFADSVKESIRQTAAELMKEMPAMVRRLAQREYDFILIPPVKRRLLFKMYIMGIFLNGRREKLEKDKLTMPAVNKVYRSSRLNEEYEPDDGYYEDMYPEVEERPLRRPDTALSVGIFSDAGLDDDIALEEAEEWTRDHPLSAGLANQGFEDDVSAILRDDLSDSVSAMMDGVPTGSRSLSRLSAVDKPGSSRHLYTRLVVMDRPGSHLTVTPASHLSPPPTAEDGSGTPRPPSASGSPRPTSGTPRPPSASGTPRPPSASGTPRPPSASGTPRPPSASGTRPSSGQAGSRPGSAGGLTPSRGSRPSSAQENSQVNEEEWRQSPLPGQTQSPPPAEGGEAEGSSGGVHSLSPGRPGQSEA